MDDLISDLNEDQKAAVLLPLTSPLIIQAGPGSGKTLTLAARIGKAVFSNRDKVNGCLVLTFSRNAVQEMKDRIGNYAATKSVHSQSPGLLNRSVDICTFHSYSFKLIKNHFSLLGYSNPPIICNTKSSRKIMTSILSHHPELSHCVTDSAEGRAALSAVIKCIRLAKMSADATEHLVKNERAPLIPILRQYQQKLVQSGMIEYVDMIPTALNLLVTNQNVLHAELQRLPYVFCDEFQDTNRMQLRLLLTLASHGRVTIVGDSNQLIFGFQGAEQSNFSKFIDFFTGRTIPVNFVSLRVNYRSTPSIVRASNSIASHQFPPGKVVVHSSTRTQPMEMVSSLTFSQTRPAEDDVTMQSFPVQIHESSSDSQEFAYVSNLVLQLAQGRVHSSFLRRHNSMQSKPSSIGDDLSAIDVDEYIQLPPIALTDIAVLYRTNAIGNAFKEYLQTNYRQIPFTITSNSQQEDTDAGFDAPTAITSADTTSAKTFMQVVHQWLTFLLDYGSDSDLFLSILKHRFMSAATSSSVSKITMNAIDTAELLFRQSTAPNSRSMFLILGDVLEANNDGSQSTHRRNGPAQKTYPHAKALKSWYVTICSMLSEIKAQEITLNRLVDKVIAASNVQADVDAAINKLESAKRSMRGGSTHSSNSFQGRFAQSSTQSLKRSYADISSNRSVNTTNSFAPFEENEEYLRVVNFAKDMKAEVSLFLKYRGGVSAKHHVDNVRFQLKGFVEHLQHLAVSGRHLNELSYKANVGSSLSSSQLDSQLDSCHSSSQSIHVSSQVSLQGQLFLGTIHKAKGREWKVVILLKANDDVFRFNTTSGGDGEDDDDLVTASMEDERRLLFVALSRAKRLLVVSFVGKSREKLESELSRLLKPVLQLVGNTKQRTESMSSTAAGSGLPAVMYTFQHDLSKFKSAKPPTSAFVPSQSVWSKAISLGMDGPSFQKASSVIDDSNKKLCVDNGPVRTPLDTINRPNSFQYHGRRPVDADVETSSEASVHSSKNSNFDWKLSSSSSSSVIQHSQSQSNTLARGDYSSAVHRSGGYVDHRLSLWQPAIQIPSSSLSRDSTLLSYSKSDDFVSSKDKKL